MDKLELFTVYLKKDTTIDVEINQSILSSTGTKLKEIEKKMDKVGLYKAVESFIYSLRDGEK